MCVFFSEANFNKIMVCVRDVNQSDFVAAFAAFLKKSGKINVPKWADYAKTSPAREMPPASDDWFYTRVAAVARQVYIKGELGVGNLSTIFGSAISRGMKPHHHRKGNGHIARVALQQLEAIKMVKKGEKGRRITREGQKAMDQVAQSLSKQA